LAKLQLAVLHKGAVIYLDRIEANWPLRLQVPVARSRCLTLLRQRQALLAYLPVAGA